MDAPQNQRIEDMPKEDRPRERFDRIGAAGVDIPTLLAIILRSGSRGMNVYKMATELYQHYGSLKNLLGAGQEGLQKAVKGLGPDKVRTLYASFELARRATLERLGKTPRLDCPENVALLLQEEALQLTQEHLWVLCLDTRNKLLGQPHVVTKGTVNGTLVHSREVYRKAIVLSATSIILVHNHPSGDITPSPEDIRSTRDMLAAGRTLGIRLLDHIILGRPVEDGSAWYTSIRQTGLVSFEE